MHQITEEEIQQLAQRINALSKEQIDKLFSRLGWMDAEAEHDGNKALPNHRLEFIKKSVENSKIWVNNLLFDTPNEKSITEIKQALIKFLDENK